MPDNLINNILINKIGPSIQFLRFDDKSFINLKDTPDNIPRIDSYRMLDPLFEKGEDSLPDIVSRLPVANAIKLDENGNPINIFEHILPGQPVFMPFAVNSAAGEENNIYDSIDWALVVGTSRTNKGESVVFPSYKTIKGMVENITLGDDKLADGLWMGSTLDEPKRNKISVHLSDDKYTKDVLCFVDEPDKQHSKLAILDTDHGGYLGAYEEFPEELRAAVESAMSDDGSDFKYASAVIKEGDTKKYYFNLQSVIKYLYDVVLNGRGILNNILWKQQTDAYGLSNTAFAPEGATIVLAVKVGAKFSVGSNDSEDIVDPDTGPMARISVGNDTIPEPDDIIYNSNEYPKTGIAFDETGFFIKPNSTLKKNSLTLVEYNDGTNDPEKGNISAGLFLGPNTYFNGIGDDLIPIINICENAKDAAGNTINPFVFRRTRITPTIYNSLVDIYGQEHIPEIEKITGIGTLSVSLNLKTEGYNRLKTLEDGAYISDAADRVYNSNETATESLIHFYAKVEENLGESKEEEPKEYRENDPTPYLISSWEEAAKHLSDDPNILTLIL